MRLRSVAMDNWHTALALTYHEETKHSYESIYRSRHFLDWTNQPQPFKRYCGLEAIPLPAELPVTQMPALLALSPPGEMSVTTPVPTLHDLAYMLFYAAGVTKRRFYPGHGEMLFRAAACTGALYHIDLYLSACDIPGLQAGLYHFDPRDFVLYRLRQGDYRRVLLEASGNDPALQEAPVIIIGSDTFWRNAWKYRARAYRHSFWDAGTILANLLAVAAAAELPAHVVQSFVDAEVNRLLDLDVEREVALGLVALGTGVAPPPPAPAISPLGLATLPPSAREIAYPLIGRAHMATSLTSPADVVAARVPVPAPLLDAPGVPLQPLPADTVQSPIERVILRRGSTRRFPHEPLGMAELASILQAAAQPFDTDCPVTPEPYLIVHAVDGLDPGTYALDVAR